MGSKSVKDSLVKGTIILAVAALTARVLGMIQRVPLKHLLDDAGMATYGIANNIYLALLIIATAGVPTALSKLVSEKIELGRRDEAGRIFRAAVWFAIVVGVVITVVLYASASYVAKVSGDPEAALAIRAIAPVLLLFPLIAIMRGYFQGRQKMAAGGLSQIVEQILRVVTSVGLAFIILQIGYSREWAAAGASFGSVIGSIGALAVMVYYWVRLKKADHEEQRGRSYQTGRMSGETSFGGGQRREQPLSTKQIYAIIFRISIPISFISLAVPLINVIDSTFVIPLLTDSIGAIAAKDTLGILSGRAQSLAGIPPVLAIALSQSIVPVVSSAFARGDMREVSRKASQALQISVMTGLPIVILLCVAARPLNGFVFADVNGSTMIVLLTASSMFQIVMMTSAAILMGLGAIKPPILNVFLGIAVKFAATFALAPLFGINGIIAATAFCFIVTMVMNMLALRRRVKVTVMGKKFRGLVAAAIVAIGVGAAVEWVTNTYIHLGGTFLTYLFNSLLVGGITALVYGILILRFSVITSEEVRMYPAPLQKLLNKFVR